MSRGNSYAAGMVAARGSSVNATVVGAGPSGLMAAEMLAREGCAVTVYEHKPSVAWKFLLAGKGGLNITHSEPFDEFVLRYGEAGTRLGPALTRFSPDELRAWCAGLGLETFVGTSGRVFPKSLRATPLLRAWLIRLGELGVEFRLRHSWLGFEGTGPVVSVFSDSHGHTHRVTADATVLALGGGSWPRTGSTAQWVVPFRDAGIDVSQPAASNCGVQVAWRKQFVERFAGKPLKNVSIVVGEVSHRGDCTVTTAGLEGGPVYAHSAALRGLLARSEPAQMYLDLKPDLTAHDLKLRLQKRRSKESTSTWLRKAGFGPLEVNLLREVTHNTIPENPAHAAVLFKAAPVSVLDLMPIDRAISSAGGIRLAEVDDDFMLHKLPGVFVAGEMLDWEAPTGGYLLQACFSTGVAAATGALAWVASRRPETC